VNLPAFPSGRASGLDLAASELRRARDVAVHNAPLYDLAGDAEQAKLCRAVAQQCCIAIDLVSSGRPS